MIPSKRRGLVVGDSRVALGIASEALLVVVVALDVPVALVVAFGALVVEVEAAAAAPTVLDSAELPVLDELPWVSRSLIAGTLGV